MEEGMEVDKDGKNEEGIVNRVPITLRERKITLSLSTLARNPIMMFGLLFCRAP
jgi:hypothetical protein